MMDFQNLINTTEGEVQSIITIGIDLAKERVCRFALSDKALDSSIPWAPHVNDVTQAHALAHGDKTNVFADAGYQGVDKGEGTQHITYGVRANVARWTRPVRALKERYRGLNLGAADGAVCALQSADGASNAVAEGQGVTAPKNGEHQLTMLARVAQTFPNAKTARRSRPGLQIIPSGASKVLSLEKRLETIG